MKDLTLLSTDDFQNRGGNYPKSNVPDTIYAEGTTDKGRVEMSFKNTNEATARKKSLDIIEKHVGNLTRNIKSTHVYQTGDYQDDWVDSVIIFDVKGVEQ